MYFISPFFLPWSRKHFKHSRDPQPSSPFDISNERELMASTDKHHVDVVNSLQTVKRLYSLERRLFVG